jgi:hypothetical protein
MFVNPFKKHDISEFPGVLVPLDQANHRPSVAPAPAPVHRASLATSEQHESEKADNDKAKDSTDRRPDSDASSGIVNNGLTREALKAEIEADLAANDTDTAYDRKFARPSFARTGNLREGLV